MVLVDRPKFFLDCALFLKWLNLDFPKTDGWAKVVSGDEELKTKLGISVLEVDTVRYWNRRVQVGSKILEIDELELIDLVSEKCKENNINYDEFVTNLAVKYFS